ncbi:uncharacterized protein LOC133289022 [Gastrolobium bilobum]|uniref:uncharacterized protein LOC133289022 n=1 Tax=Gastrolobium bilobum TaxID=150636 RepID=UPI002AB2B00E|nr:uncharacterized protein LOC133289022 [Gastrolobium bilobum]
MRSLLYKNLLFLSSSCSSSPARALHVRLQVCELSSSPHYWRRVEEESRNVRVSVWWDFENCNLPVGVNVSKIAPAITEAVRANGIRGPLHITAFGDVLQLSKANQEVLACTGIHLSHVPNGGKNSADRSLLVDLMYWVSQNPPPAHLFLISGDRDFAGTLHRLRMNNYNILLAVPGKAPDVLCSSATIMWQWSSLLKGEDLSGKHFNHPPDGQFGSWYGNSKVPLEKPVSAIEQSTSLQNVEIYEPSSDLKLGTVPESVARKVKSILSLHPEGISITDLRAELANCDVRLDKNLYGYKRFSRFLLSIPNLQLQALGDGKFCVHSIPSDSPEPFESSAVPSTASAVKNDRRAYAATSKLNSAGKNMARDADGTPSMASLHERSMDDDPKSFQPIPSQDKPIEKNADGKSSFPSLVERDVCQPPNELRKASLDSEKVVDVANAQLSEIQQLSEANEVSKTKTGSLKTRSKKSSDNNNVRSEDVSHKILEKITNSGNHYAGNDYKMVENNGIAKYESGKFKAKDNYEKPTGKEVDEVCRSPNSSPPVDDSLVDKRPVGSAETYRKRPTFFSWIGSWWPFWKSSAKSVDSAAHQNKVVSHFEDPKLSELEQTGSHSEESKLSELDKTGSHSEESKLSELGQNVSHSVKPELFSNDSFWNVMESFVFTPNGSLLFSQSRSREDMAHKLQKDGPLVLRSLTEKDILQVVDLLIAEKKWLEESPSQEFPFKVTQPVQKSSLMGQSHRANGLRSLFLSRTSQSSLQKSYELDVEKHNQSIPHTRVSTPATETKYTERSRNDMLQDCQKLVSEILRKHPEGYNIGRFRKLYVDRYGYHLDLQKLGYQKLASLLQIMPGVKLESTYIFPSVPAVCASDWKTSIPKSQVTDASPAVSNSDSELSDSAPKDDNIDSPWEELGPVSVNNSNQNDLESKLSKKAKELDTSKPPVYEPIVSGYDSSESEGDSSCLTQPEEHGKPKCNEQDSSLWEALDLWHSSKEGENSVKKPDNVSLADLLNSSTESTQCTLFSQVPSGNYRDKQKTPKNYSFVADPVLPNKDKLVDGILDGFKKADESKMQN